MASGSSVPPQKQSLEVVIRVVEAQILTRLLEGVVLASRGADEGRLLATPQGHINQQRTVGHVR